jgi:hypothetical protein
VNDLPDDLAHPRGERASFIANLVVGGILIALTAGVIAFYFLAGGHL